MKDKRGFTMIEMLIVVGIIALLLMLIVPNLNKRQQSINQQACLALKETVNSQIYLFDLENNRYPKDIEELITNGYLKEGQNKCKNNSYIVIENEEAIIKQ